MQGVDLALQTGRLLQKKQTGFVHLCYQSEDLLTHDTIALLENFLFVLALFRSRLSDHVLEGKALLEKLLCFEVEGNFPVYLHQFPECLDPYIGLKIAPVLFWIMHDFSLVIGETKERLKECLERILSKALLQKLPKWAEERVRSFAGEMPQIEEMTASEWAEALISAQIAEKKGGNLDKILEEASSLWHPELLLYIGPSTRRNQEGGEPELTLFDLFMATWQKTSSLRLTKLHSVQLKASLIRPLSQLLQWKEQPTPYIYFQKEEEIPFWIAWKNHSLVLAKKALHIEGDKEELILQYPLELPENDEKSLEVNFFLNYHEEHTILVKGKKATVFNPEEGIEIHSNGYKIEIFFQIEEGSFLGHILRGNRPSQHYCKGENIFTAYDWRIALRTISRNPQTTIRVQIQQKQESLQQSPLHVDHCPHTL